MVLIYLTVTGKETSPTKDTGMQAAIIGIAYGSLPVIHQYAASEGTVNPWIDFFTSLYRVIDYENDEEDWKYMYINLIIPFVGAILAFVVHQFILHSPSHHTNNILYNCAYITRCTEGRKRC
jgi:glycerol uptake facilitator-like aquaporin